VSLFSGPLLEPRVNHARYITVAIPPGYLSFGPIENNIMFFVTSACARRTGAASQAFERMHNTLSHRVKT
jgi:hypothetical protein